MSMTKLMTRIPLKVLLTRKWLNGYETAWLLYNLCETAVPIDDFFRLVKEHNIPFYAYSHELCRDLKACYGVDFNDDFDHLQVVLEDGSPGYVPTNELIKMPHHALVSVDPIDPPERGMLVPALRTSHIAKNGFVFSSALLTTSKKTEWSFNPELFLNAPKKDRLQTGHIYFATRDIQRLAEIINSSRQATFSNSLNDDLSEKIAKLEAENTTLKKALEDTTEPPRKSAFLVIARALELHQRGEPLRYTQGDYVEQLLDGCEHIHGMSRTTVNQILADAKKVLKEAQKN